MKPIDAGRLLVAATLAVGLAAPAARTIAAPSADAIPANAKLVKSRAGIEQYRLASNGMDILLVPSHAAPVVTFLVVVRVGSRNEAPGNTGSAHLLEHLLFNKSTENFSRAKGRTIQQVLYEAGGDFSTSNMTTWNDRITMYDTLPADRLETTMKINADRLRRGLILDAERKPEMTVVRNEYERGENDPEQALFKAVNGAAVVAHPYHWDTIGYKSDIEGVSTEQLRKHYDTFFWPDNSTAVLVGDFDKSAALALFDREFGGFPKAPAPIPQVVTTEPPQEGERRVIVRRAGAVPLVALAWLRPGARDPQYYPFEVLATILGNGISSRLHQSLVETRLATSVSTYNWAFRDPFLLVLNATVSTESPEGRSSKVANDRKVEEGMREIVEAIRDKGVTGEEVARAKALIEADVALSRDGTYGTAQTLGEAIAASDWEWWVDYLDRIKAVTPADVKAVAVQWLGPDQVTVGVFIPKTGESGAGGAEGKAAGTAGASRARYARDPHVPAVSDLPSMGRGEWGAEGPGAATSGRASSTSAASGGSRTTAGSFAARTRRAVLPNGAVILLLPNTLSDTVSVRVRVRAGSYLDGDRPGLAEAVAGMLSRGTAKRTKAEIARDLESQGTTFSWNAEEYDVVGRGACLAKNLPDLLRTIVEEMQTPSFPQDELDKLKEEMRAGILQQDDSTFARALEGLSRSLYPEGHPLRAHTAAERTAALAAIGSDDLRRFHEGHYGGSGLIVALCGKFDTKALEKDLGRLLAGVPRGKTAPVEAARVATPAAKRVVVAMKDKASADIMIGAAGGLRRKDPDYYAAYLANAVLGQSSLSSRLGAQVRDVEGLTYTIISRFFSADMLDGPWGVYLSVAPDNVDKGLRSTLGVLKKFIDEGIGQQELAVEKSAAAGRFQVSLSNNSGIAEALAQAESRGLGVSLLDEYPKKIRAVTLQDANRAIKVHMSADRLVTVIAGSVK